MENMAFDWQLDEFMVYCRSRQHREKTMNSYEQTLRLFERWCREQMRIEDVDKITESVIRRYINDLQARGKYSFYSNDKGKEKNFPDRRRDFRKPISVCTINNYIRKQWWVCSSMNYVRGRFVAPSIARRFFVADQWSALRTADFGTGGL